VKCYMVNQRPIGRGGNREADKSIIVRRTAALGDALCATTVADKLYERGYEVTFQGHPSTHCLLRRIRSIANVADTNGFSHVNLDGAYENDVNRRQKSFHQMFFESANDQLRARQMEVGKPLNCKPKLDIRDSEKDQSRAKFAQYPRPWVFICPRSNSYAARVVPDGIWVEAAKRINGTKFWMGMHPGPPGIVDLNIRHVDNLIVWLAVADLLVTVDTGPLHIGAALGIPIVAIGQSSSPEWHLNDQNDFLTIYPAGLDCLDCQRNLCPINEYLPPCQNVDPELIASTANRRMEKGKISAAISVYQPDLEILNRCLTAVLPQVDEVVICHDQAGRVPDGIISDPKIKVVKKNQRDIGYGRKQNFAVRHTNGEFLLLLNDDCFVDPDAVEKMKECMTPGVGMVSNLLRYPDGTIYHAGKIRFPGVRGWSHIDYRKYLPTWDKPTEVENCCGCCVLVRREAYYSGDGFDEDFYIFADDDDMALKLRREGWKIIFTPHSKGIHMEHQSVNKTGNIGGLLAHANDTFNRKWGAYLDHNLHRIPGDFSYLNQ
jgi:GT2 family glycosyltransferase/ADP-heptose:LPS heptosyltransferase